MIKFTATTESHQGFSLIEVLVGIMIFSIGMLALVQLQGGLARSARDANLRTMAINIAEEAIESKRGFSRVNVDPDGIEYAYEDIVTYQETVTRGGLNFAFEATVTDYYYDRATELFTTTQPLVAAHSDFKLMTVSVTWNDAQEFNIDETQTTSGRLGSGSITLTEIISSITSAANAKSATGGTGGLYFPSIDYKPGSKPEIISISLGENKFKESTTPLPKVLRSEQLVETKFDVVTYSQDEAGATFLRREAFIAVSCNCTLRTPAVSGSGGLRPTRWNGTEYSEAEWISKPYGESASKQQSLFCDICCRDHHDGGTGEEDAADDPGRARFNPFRDSADYWSSGLLSGDHKHYSRDAAGALSLADSDGDAYVEACRMVRKDGFMRTAHDLRQEGLNSFPDDYLDNVSEVAVYSAYVTDAVTAFEAAIGSTKLYELDPPALSEPGSIVTPVTFPASTEETATVLPTVAGVTKQQLRSRGIYIDYMSDELRTIINCLDAGGAGVDCGVPNVTTSLEIIPFFDLQLTWLTRWNETPINIPVDVSNEAIETNNLHSRGVAKVGSDIGYSTVNAAIHKGNLGLTGTDPIDYAYDSNVKDYDLFVEAYDGVPPPDAGDIIVSGSITSAVVGVKASDVEIAVTEAQCDRTNTGFICLIQAGANNPRLTLNNYAKSNVDLLACSEVLTIHGQEVSTNSWTRFNLPGASLSTADIVIKQDNC